MMDNRRPISDEEYNIRLRAICLKFTNKEIDMSQYCRDTEYLYSVYRFGEELCK